MKHLFRVCLFVLPVFCGVRFGLAYCMAVTRQQKRVLTIATSVIVLGWLIAIAGFYIARNAKVTVEKVVATLHDTDLSQLSAADRAKRLQKLADMLNKLGYKDRRKARLDDEWNKLFAQMTDAEKSKFLEDTLPTGFKQMLTAFEDLPEDKRKKAIGDAMKRLKQAREEQGPQGQLATLEGGKPEAKKREPELSPEMQQKVIKMGLNAFYKDSSAQTKAELAPFMEELQRSMENGRLFRR